MPEKDLVLIETAETYKTFKVGDRIRYSREYGRIHQIWRPLGGQWRFHIMWEGRADGRNMMVGDMHNVYPSQVHPARKKKS